MEKNNSPRRIVCLDGSGLASLDSITPQPAPTTERIKALLRRALTSPQTLTPAEIQEMAASVAYHLLLQKKE